MEGIKIRKTKAIELIVSAEEICMILDAISEKIETLEKEVYWLPWVESEITDYKALYDTMLITWQHKYKGGNYK